MYNAFKYYDIHSDIHKMNPSYKFICLLLFSLLLIASKSVLILLIIIVYLSLLIITSNVPLRLYFNNVKTISSLILFILIIDLIFGVSFINAILVITKIILLVLYTSIIMFTTTPNEITYGLDKLFLPFKKIGIPVNNVSLSISLAIRFIPIIFEQGAKILKSQASRGLDFNDKNLKIKIQSLTSIIIPMFMLSFKRADDIADIMELRMYDINNIKNNSKSYKNSFNNVMLISHLLIIILYIFKEVILI